MKRAGIFFIVAAAACGNLLGSIACTPADANTHINWYDPNGLREAINVVATDGGSCSTTLDRGCPECIAQMCCDERSRCDATCIAGDAGSDYAALEACIVSQCDRACGGDQ